MSMSIDIKELIRQCINEDYVILESLILKRYQDKLVVVSDEADRKKQSAETFRNKDKLKMAGFRWDSSINSWTIDQSGLQKAQQTLQNINKSPVEKFIEKLEEIPEFIQGAENLSRKDELTQKIEGYIDELSTAVDNATVSKAIKDYLTFNAKFHGYSFYNTMLIWLQNKNATKVAGFKQWQDKFHRRVKKGAKGITILAPIKKKIDTGEDEPDVKGDVSGPGDTGPQGDLNTPDKAKPRTYLRFMAVTVFDVADTEPIDERGELPPAPEWHASNEPNEKANELFECAKELADTMGVKLTQDKGMSGEQGWSAGGHINITSDVQGVNLAATVIHEIAHELLHHKKSSPFYIGDEGMTKISKELMELQAESTSFVVIKYFGLPADHQATYLALWKANKEEIKKNLTTIKKTADFIITELEKVHDERVKNTQQPTVAESSFPACHHRKFVLRDGGYECEACGMPKDELK